MEGDGRLGLVEARWGKIWGGMGLAKERDLEVGLVGTFPPRGLGTGLLDDKLEGRSGIKSREQNQNLM